MTERQRQRRETKLRRIAEKAATAAPTYNVARILAEQRTTGAARCYYLVEWEGYDPSWEAWRISGEPGTPVQTWEREVHVWRTEAFQVWCQQRQEA